MVEACIDDTAPRQFGVLLRRHPPRCAVGFIAGSHLYPTEQPAQSASLVLDLLRELD